MNWTMDKSLTVLVDVRQNTVVDCGVMRCNLTFCDGRRQETGPLLTEVITCRNVTVQDIQLRSGVANLLRNLLCILNSVVEVVSH